MEAGLVARIEMGAARGASALFAGAVGYCAYRLLGVFGVSPLLAVGAAAGGALAYLPCSLVLRAAGDRSATFALPQFTPAEFEFIDDGDELLLTETVATTDELVLTDADRIGNGARPTPQPPLVLDDIVAEIGPDARVVRLFDRRAMPADARTPGQLHSRIAAHLQDGAPLSTPLNPSAPPDASQALSAALAELRRSLR